MYDVCRVIAKFFFLSTTSVMALFRKMLTANLPSVVLRFIKIMMLCLIKILHKNTCIGHGKQHKILKSRSNNSCFP